MPNIVQGEKMPGGTDFRDKDFGYEYPEGLDLKPGSEFHTKLKSKIISRASDSSAVISGRFDSWNNIDKVLTTYIPLDEKEKVIKAKDERKPVSIVFPYTYTILETLLGYLCAAFFQDPIWRYEGISPEDIIGAIMMEKIIDIQATKSKMALNLHTQWRDGLAYGMGMISPSWMQTFANRTVKKEKGFIDSLRGMFRPTGGFEKDFDEVMIFEGNKLNNIDPYLSLPDPNVPVHEIQSGEFFGWIDKTNYMDLLSEEKNSEDMFNVRYIQSVHNKQTSIWGEDKSERGRKAQGDTSRYSSAGIVGRPARYSNTTNEVDVINLFVKLIPKEWKLGTREYPEKWIFSLAADDVFIRAKPLDLDHDMFPATICAPDFDGYSSTPISRLEKLYGLQGHLDWMFNTHVANVRKVINDVILYDPYLINSNDLKRPGPGKLVRMRRPAWGKGVKDALMQLPVTDITRGHMADTTFIIEWMNRVGIVNEAMQGALRQGGPERLTKAEFQGSSAGGFSRLERMAKMISLQSMQDLGYMLASNTQQLMDEETYVKASGEWEQVLMDEFGKKPEMLRQGRLKVNPFDLLVEYDLKVRDGSIPGSKSSDVMVRMFEMLTKVPELAQKFDLVRIFKHIARESGVPNVDDFVRVQVMEDEQVEQQVQAGNLVSTEGMV